VFKPAFEKCAVGRLTIAFNPIVVSIAKSPYDVYAFKSLPGPDIFDNFPPGCAGIFPLQIGIYAAFVNVYAFIIRNSVEPFNKLYALFL
jgi:hypothetical protein